MRRQLPAIVLGVLIGSALLIADSVSVNFDPNVDFSKFRTFAIRVEAIESPRPELDNRLFLKDLSTVVRASLFGKRLTESAAQPDLLVDIRVTNGDVSTVQRGTHIPGPVPGLGRSTGPQTVRYTEATLVIDILKPGDGNPIWRGVYHSDQGTGSKLVAALPGGAKKLLAKYPSKK